MAQVVTDKEIEKLFFIGELNEEENRKLELRLVVTSVLKDDRITELLKPKNPIEKTLYDRITDILSLIVEHGAKVKGLTKAEVVKIIEQDFGKRHFFVNATIDSHIRQGNLKLDGDKIFPIDGYKLLPN